MRRLDKRALVQLDTAAVWLALWSCCDEVDGHADLVSHAHDSERHRRRGHAEVAELPARIRGDGRGQIAAVALGDDVERDLLGVSADGHVAGKRERERASRRQGQREPAGFRWYELRFGELPHLQGVLLDEAVAIAFVARERRQIEADLRT